MAREMVARRREPHGVYRMRPGGEQSELDQQQDGAQHGAGQIAARKLPAVCRGRQQRQIIGGRVPSQMLTAVQCGPSPDASR